MTESIISQDIEQIVPADLQISELEANLIRNPKPFLIQKNRRAYKCHYSQCGRIFKEKGNLRTHLRVHTGERPFKCHFEGCGRCFITLGNLKSHIFNHTGEKLFPCPVPNCEKQYTRLCRLRIHERTHTGFKPFPCPFPNCGKFFNEKGNLKTHYRIHTGEKPYQCKYPGCPHSFKAHGHLKDHERRHRNIRPYKCRVCGISVQKRLDFKIHLQTHSTDCIVCPVNDCGRRFIEKDSLKSHLKVTHEKDLSQYEHLESKLNKMNVEFDNYSDDTKENLMVSNNDQMTDHSHEKNNNNFSNNESQNNNKEKESLTNFIGNKNNLITPNKKIFKCIDTKIISVEEKVTEENSETKNNLSQLINNIIKTTSNNVSQLPVTDKVSPLTLSLMNYYHVLFANAPDMNNILSVMNMAKFLNIPVENLLTSAYIYFANSKFDAIIMNNYLMNLQKVVLFFNSNEFKLMKNVLQASASSQPHLGNLSFNSAFTLPLNLNKA